MKARHQMNIDELIANAGWWKGTERDWQALPMEEREELAYRATGCLVAYPTWEAPVDCVHIDCEIRRGEKEPIELTRAILSSERNSGWLRFMPAYNFTLLQAAVEKCALTTGVYDPWKMPGSWQAIVYGGLLT